MNMPSGRRYTNVESKPQGWKPSIKVGYKEPLKVDVSIKDIKIVKHPVFQQEPKPCRRKRIETARSGFSLKDSLYSDLEAKKQLKGSTDAAYSKYFKSTVFSKESSQAPDSSRSSKSVLPSYKSNNFKSIIQYGEAGNYRSEPFT